jgi:hypothetical protein
MNQSNRIATTIDRRMFQTKEEASKGGADVNNCVQSMYPSFPFLPFCCACARQQLRSTSKYDIRGQKVIGPCHLVLGLWCAFVGFCDGFCSFSATTELTRVLRGMAKEVLASYRSSDCATTGSISFFAAAATTTTITRQGLQSNTSSGC